RERAWPVSGHGLASCSREVRGAAPPGFADPRIPRSAPGRHPLAWVEQRTDAVPGLQWTGLEQRERGAWQGAGYVPGPRDPASLECVEVPGSRWRPSLAD